MKRSPPIRRKGSRITILQKEATSEHWKNFKNKVETGMEALRSEFKDMFAQYPTDEKRNGREQKWN